MTFGVVVTSSIFVLDRMNKIDGRFGIQEMICQHFSGHFFKLQAPHI